MSVEAFESESKVDALDVFGEDEGTRADSNVHQPLL